MVSNARGPRVDISTASLRSLRIERGWTQLDLAYHSGITPATISRLENGWQSPNLDTAKRLAQTLDVSLDKIAGSILEFRPARQTPMSERVRKANSIASRRSAV